jgi:hypothetical protein
LSVDLIPPDSIITFIMDQHKPSNSTDHNVALSVTDVNIRKIISQYYTPTISESSKGVVVTFTPKGHSGPEAIIWFENAKKGFQRKPISTNQWMMVDCDLKPIHELLNKYFTITEGDFNVTRMTLSAIAHETLKGFQGKSN